MQRAASTPPPDAHRHSSRQHLSHKDSHSATNDYSRTAQRRWTQHSDRGGVDRCLVLACMPPTMYPPPAQLLDPAHQPPEMMPPPCFHARSSQPHDMCLSSKHGKPVRWACASAQGTANSRQAAWVGAACCQKTPCHCKRQSQQVCHHSLRPGQRQQPSSACKGPAHRLLAHNLQPMHATRATSRAC